MRALRAVRQSVELGFRIEDATYNLIRRDAPLLAAVSGERVRDELMRIVSAPGAWQHVRTLASLDLLAPTLPEVASLIGVTQSAPHYQDVFDHTRAVMAHLEGIYALLWPDVYRIPQAVADDATVIADESQWLDVADLLAPYADDLRAHLMQPLAAGRVRRGLLFWAALAHDWGKPAMRTLDEDGRTRFYGHDQWGTVLVGHRGQALKLSSDEITYLTRLVDAHMRPTLLAQEDLAQPPGASIASITIWATPARTARCSASPTAWRRARRSPTPRAGAGGRRRLRCCWRPTSALEPSRLRRPPLMNGRQLMAEFGLKPGPRARQVAR